MKRKRKSPNPYDNRKLLVSSQIYVTLDQKTRESWDVMKKI